MNRICRMVTSVFFVVYVLALAVFLIGTLGLFGQERDPLSAVFLMPLGLPWNRMLDLFSEPLWPWLAAAAPAVNYLILRLVCRVITAPKA